MHSIHWCDSVDHSYCIKYKVQPRPRTTSFGTLFWCSRGASSQGGRGACRQAYRAFSSACKAALARIDFAVLETSWPSHHEK